jgi:hypothetical protein
MNINNIDEAIFIGSIVDNPKSYSGNKHVHYSHKLMVNYSQNLPSGLVNRHLSIVYFVCVDDIVYKIGQTSGKGGIKACMSFYCGAGQDDCGPNRFTINALIREELSKGNKVDVYMKYIEPITISVSGIDRQHTLVVPISAKALEHAHLMDYEQRMGCLPAWNFQEAGHPVPAHINEQFASYRQLRAKGRT